MTGKRECPLFFSGFSATPCANGIEAPFATARRTAWRRLDPAFALRRPTWVRKKTADAPERHASIRSPSLTYTAGQSIGAVRHLFPGPCRTPQHGRWTEATPTFPIRLHKWRLGPARARERRGNGQVPLVRFPKRGRPGREGRTERARPHHAAATRISPRAGTGSRRTRSPPAACRGRSCPSPAAPPNRAARTLPCRPGW